MRFRIVTVMMLLMLCFSATANADQWYGEFYADGFGLTESEAAANAQDSLDAFVTGWEAILEPGQEILVVVGETSWDDPIYTITFWVVVLDSPT